MPSTTMSSTRTRVVIATKRASPLSSRSHTRSFRVESWSSYLDPLFEKEMQRRNRILKHKYAKALQRKLSWDLQPHKERPGWKSFMCGALQWRDVRPGGRWISINELRTAFEDYNLPESERPVKTPGCQHTMSNKTTAPTSGQYQEYKIDAITGRKIYSSSKSNAPEGSAPSQIPVQTFKGYRSQFSNMIPPPVINLDGPPMHQEELERYGQPFEWNEPDGKPPKPADSGEVVEEDISSYIKQRPALSLDPDSPPVTPEELQAYRKPYQYNEPDGQRSSEADILEPSKEEPDVYRQGKPSSTLDPDSPPLTQEELSRYRKPYEYNEPDGQLQNQQDLSAPSEQDLAAPSEQELGLYGKKPEPRAIFDSDGPPMTPEELGVYRKPYQHNEPDGKPVEQVESFPAPTQEDLDLYRKPTTVPGPARCSKSQGRTRVELPNAISSKRLSAFRTKDTDTREDLDLLRPEDVRARSGIAKSSKTETVREKEAKRKALEEDYNKAAERESVSWTDIIADQERYKRNAALLHGQTKAAATKSEGKKMTGNYTRDFPEDFATTWTARNDTLVPKTLADPWGFSNTPQGLELSYQQEKEIEIQAKENENTSAVSSQESFSRLPSTPRIQTALDRSRSPNPAANCDASGYSREPCGLETSYKDECIENGDPEPAIFNSSYSKPTTEADSKEVDQKTKGERRDAYKALVREIREIYESKYGPINSKHHQQKASISAKPATDRISDLSRVIVDVQRANQHLSRVRSEIQKQLHSTEIKLPEKVAVSALPPAPTLYKILAYDSTMQEVNIAETTSIVEDHSSILTPAEVLLRLSNPAKFFPHFAPLHNDGFEIVSGSGDVLVFRKVRDGAPISNVKASAAVASSTATTNATAAAASAENTSNTIGRFKSGIDVRREEPVFSGGRAAWEGSESGKSKGGAGKRLLIGAGWVAVCSYAVGVVTEFFTTGGADGAGAVGL